ncbi:hypothetical protein AAF712_014653 [Marasmius tenuissimus]|uniref:Uncharacterized protein n=1 Tax=Marasmius tenuissimus TaxID=585030 RepID=A0ABR2ZD28_9AGAR
MASADPQLPTLTVSQAFTLAWYRGAPAPTFEGFKFEAGQDDKVLMRITLGQNAAGQIIQSNFALTALPGQLNLLADYVEHSSGQVYAVLYCKNGRNSALFYCEKVPRAKVGS